MGHGPTKPAPELRYHTLGLLWMCGCNRTVFLWSPPVMNPQSTIQKRVSKIEPRPVLEFTGFQHSSHSGIGMILGVVIPVFKTMVCWTWPGCNRKIVKGGAWPPRSILIIHMVTMWCYGIWCLWQAYKSATDLEKTVSFGKMRDRKCHRPSHSPESFFRACFGRLARCLDRKSIK